MAIRKVLTEGDPALRKKARAVEKFDQRLKTLAEDMLETMREYNGIGLAAPQVGILRRIFVMNLGGEEDEDTVVVNPIIIEAEGSCIGEEGCLSLPGLVGNVERPERIVLEAQDLEGNTFVREYEGLAAVCVCHETDHLDGILYRDRALEPLVELSSLEDEEDFEVRDDQ